MPILDHLTIAVADLEKSTAFYKAALAPLGAELLTQFPGMSGFGAGGKADFWIGTMAAGKTTSDAHLAFTAPGRAAVRAFYDAAIAAGGKDNGPPGVRAQYHENYYAAFVIDPDGHNIEAVCHEAYLG